MPEASMADHAFREQVTLTLMEDALEANDRHYGEAISHLLDVAGTLILHAVKNGAHNDAFELSNTAAEYLVGQIVRRLEAEGR